MESLAIILKLHTPEQLQFYSNIAHWIEGVIFLVVAIIAFLQALGFLQKKNLIYLWPSLILVSGLFLPIFAFSHHLKELPLAWQATIYDAQQRQHMIMAILIAAAGVAEIAYLKGRNKKTFLQLVFPLVLTIIGLMFITHPQHGTGEAVLRAMTIHQYLGSVLILSGLFKTAEVFGRNTIKWLVFPWILFLVIAATLLISYREPEGAYRIEVNSMNQQM